MTGQCPLSTKSCHSGGESRTSQPPHPRPAQSKAHWRELHPPRRLLTRLLHVLYPPPAEQGRVGIVRHLLGVRPRPAGYLREVGQAELAPYFLAGQAERRPVPRRPRPPPPPALPA